MPAPTGVAVSQTSTTRCSSLHVVLHMRIERCIGNKHITIRKYCFFFTFFVAGKVSKTSNHLRILQIKK